MEREIILTVNDDELIASQSFGGYEGEHQATILKIEIPQSWNSAVYNYMLKLEAGGETYYTELLRPPLRFAIPQAVMLEGTLYVQLKAYKGSLLIRESGICPLKIKKSLNPAVEVEGKLIGLLDEATAKYIEAAYNPPYIGNNGNWFRYDLSERKYVDMAKPSRGEKGEKGEIGPPGPQGLTGIQGPRGEQGATGPKGEPGPQGAEGPRGLQGIQGLTGPKGDKGDRGIQGPAGEQGPQGMQGPVGPKGDPGEKGSVGPQGIQGPIGPQGVKGDQGVTGPQGPAGPKGDPGDSYDDTQLRESIMVMQPYADNQIIGYAEGVEVQISDAAPGTFLESAVIRGQSIIDEAAGTVVPLSPQAINISGSDGTIENHAGLPQDLQLYNTPNDQYYDTYDAVSGILTRNCTVFAMSGGFIYGYNQASETIVWITDPLFRASKSYYLIKGGIVTSSTVDWQGKIQIVIPKTDAGITSTDTSAQARAKMIAYWGGAYAILPAKTPATEQYEGVNLKIPAKECVVVCNNAYMDVTYCRDINTAWKKLTDYATDLQQRIASLEAKG